MSTIRQQIQMEFNYFKQKSMQQLDDTYDRRIAALEQQRQGMKLALEQVIDYQLYVTLEKLEGTQCSWKLDIPLTPKQEVHSTEV